MPVSLQGGALRGVALRGLVAVFAVLPLSTALALGRASLRHLAWLISEMLSVRSHDAAPESDVTSAPGAKVLLRQVRAYWEHVLLEKHPVLRGRERDVEAALGNPDEVRRSRKDPALLLFYAGGSPRWTCAVTKAEGTDGFLVTAYVTDAIKIGEAVWTRSR